MLMSTPTIVVIDNDPLNCELVTELLTDEGYHVADDATSARLVIGLAQQLPALLILDLHGTYPASGWEILTQIRRRSATRTLPVILLTADAQFGQQYRAHIRALGAIVVKKPFLAEDLLDTVACAIGSGQTAMAKSRIHNTVLSLSSVD
jgi:CheY-like chemotaxis protein